MIYLVIAQIAKIGVVWSKDQLTKKVLRTVVCAGIGAAILDREHKRRKAYAKHNN